MEALCGQGTIVDLIKSSESRLCSGDITHKGGAHTESGWRRIPEPAPNIPEQVKVGEIHSCVDD